MSQCEVASNCFNNSSGCWMCKYANPEEPQQWYSAINKAIKHPQAVKDREELKRQKRAEATRKKVDKNREKSKIVIESEQAEIRVQKTLNSGRTFRDGDLCTDDLTIDVKMQSRNVNPIIFASEFKKVQTDAIHAGKRHGVLVLENSLGQAYCVMSLELFKELI